MYSSSSSLTGDRLDRIRPQQIGQLCVAAIRLKSQIMLDGSGLCFAQWLLVFVSREDYCVSTKERCGVDSAN